MTQFAMCQNAFVNDTRGYVLVTLNADTENIVITQCVTPLPTNVIADIYLATTTTALRTPTVQAQAAIVAREFTAGVTMAIAIA